MEIKNSIKGAIQHLTNGNPDGRRVLITALKDIVREDGFSINEIDAALIEMARTDRVLVMMRHDDPTEVTPRDRQYAVKFGNQFNHVLYYRG